MIRSNGIRPHNERANVGESSARPWRTYSKTGAEVSQKLTEALQSIISMDTVGLWISCVVGSSG